MKQATCGSCRYYQQHYAFDQRKIFRVYCGHCTLNRVKRMRPDAKVCDRFIPGLSREDAFVSKEYLSKELLQYMLRLELLPEIEKKRGK